LEEVYNYDNKAIKYYYILLVSNRLTPLVSIYTLARPVVQLS